MSRRRLSPVVLVVVVAILVALPASALGAPSGWWVKRVLPQTDTANFTGSPRVTDRLVAAITGPDDDLGSQVWVWQLGASAPSLVSTASVINNVIWDASGSRLAWRSTYGGHEHVVTWALGDTEPTELVSGSDYDDIGVSGDRVVWRDTAAGRVCTWKLGDSGVTTASAQPFGSGQYNPSVSGDRIVYEQSNGSAYQVVMWTVGGGDPSALMNDAVQHIEPVIDGTRVAWTDYYGGYDAWVRTMVIGGSEPATLGPIAWSPKIWASGDRLVWIPYATAGNPQLVTWKASDTALTTVTVPAEYVAAYPQEPDVSGNRLVWIDVAQSYPQLNTQVIGEASASAIATGGLFYPGVAGNAITWRCTTGGAEGIWVANKQVAPHLSVPKTSVTKPTHGKYFRFTGSIRTADAFGGKISLRVRRYYSGKWHTVKTYSASLGAGRTTYAYKLKLSKAGKFSVRASHAADFAHTSQATSYRTFSVK